MNTSGIGMKDNILITGGCGFIGSHFTRLVKNSDLFNKIVIVDKMTYAGNLDNINDIQGIKVYPYVGIENSCIKEILEENEIDIIINFAAETHVDRSIQNPLAFVETDILGICNLVLSSKEYGKIRQFFHISTDEVYGSISRGVFDEDCLLKEDEATENYPLNPTSPYAASKAAADMMLRAYYKTYDFPLTIIRPCNNYGPNQYPEKLIPLSIMRMLQGESILLHGLGEEIREWIYVEDCVKLILDIVNQGQIGEIYNLGSGFRLNNKEVIINIIEYFMSIVWCAGGDYNDFIQCMPNRPGNDKRYALNSEKLRSLIKIYHNTPFSKGLKQTVEWYRNNRNHYKNINFDANIYKENKEWRR